jgi:hypothetical protein
MLEAERQFRRIIGYRDLAELVIAIERQVLRATTPTSSLSPWLSLTPIPVGRLSQSPDDPGIVPTARPTSCLDNKRPDLNYLRRATPTALIPRVTSLLESRMH